MAKLKVYGIVIKIDFGLPCYKMFLMKKIVMNVVLACLTCMPGVVVAQENISLPEPVKTGGMSLNDALSQRKTIRKQSKKELDMRQVSNLLWAANGLNRPDENKYTAPTARNRQELELYILLPQGAYSYNARENKLVRITGENLLEASGAFGAADIVIVYDTSKNSEKMADVDSGFIGQNVYLFCAANKMGACFKGSVKPAVVKALKLAESKKAIYTISVGMLD